MRLDDLLEEYQLARAFTEALVSPLSQEELTWRPHADSSAIAWHLGHQAAVNHFMLRNLTAAEPSLNAAFDELFDSAGPQPGRGALPPMDELFAYRETIARRTSELMGRIDRGQLGAPNQMRQVGGLLLTSLINHEYQHDCWIDEVRQTLGAGQPAQPRSGRLIQERGYFYLDPACMVGAGA